MYSKEKITFMDSKVNEYISGFDITDGRIRLKILHTKEVIRIMNDLTHMMGCDAELAELAYLSALYHDIARYEQVTKYDTFLDNLSFDHGDRGCEIILEQGFLDHLTENDRKKVLTAVARHNKYEIGEVEDEETLLLCKLIRDADKCDIFRVFACEDMVDTMGETIEQVSKETITDVVMESMLGHRCVNKNDRRTGLDKWVGFLGFIYDLNFRESIDIVKKDGYYRMPFDKAEFQDAETAKRVKVILEDLEEYIGK